MTSLCFSNEFSRTEWRGHADSFAALLPKGKEWFTAREAAAIIGCSDQFIRDCIEDQRILGHQTRPAPRRKGGSSRPSYRIHRDGILLYLMETANYEPRDLIERLGELLRHRSPEQRRALQHWLTAS